MVSSFPMLFHQLEMKREHEKRRARVISIVESSVLSIRKSNQKEIAVAEQMDTSSEETGMMKNPDGFDQYT